MGFFDDTYDYPKGPRRPDDRDGFTGLPVTQPTTVVLPPTGQTDPANLGTEEVEPFSWTPPPYTGPSRPTYNIGPSPVFRAPRFKGLTFEEAQQSPGFQFRLNAGREALEHSAAAKGATRTGGTLKDILEYGQKYGAEEYQNEWARAMQAYDRDYNAALAEFSPDFAAWQARLGAETGAGNLAFQRAFDLYTFPITEERLREQMLLDAQARALAGLGGVM